jgi:hypothetical protein
MSGLFAADGCVQPNIPTRLYQVTFAADCEHARIAAAVIVVRATDETSARSYADGLILPRTYITEVRPIAEGGVL